MFIKKCLREIELCLRKSERDRRECGTGGCKFIGNRNIM